MTLDQSLSSLSLTLHSGEFDLTEVLGGGGVGERIGWEEGCQTPQALTWLLSRSQA